MRGLSLLLVFLLLEGVPTVPVQAQVRRCLSSAGSVVYTDRQCPDIGATSVMAPISPAAGGIGTASSLRSMCARNVRDLAYGLESAVQSGDANQISSLYDWTGVGNAAADRLMNHFDRIATRTFVDIVPIFAVIDGTPLPDVPIHPADSTSTAATTQSPAPIPTPIPTPTQPSRRLVGLRIEQVLSDGHTPSHETFGLRRRMGCWWIRN